MRFDGKIFWAPCIDLSLIAYDLNLYGKADGILIWQGRCLKLKDRSKYNGTKGKSEHV